MAIWPRSKPIQYGIAVVVVLIVAVGLLMARQAVKAKGALEDAANQARTLQSQITDGDTTHATATLAELQSSTHTARTNTDGPLWGALSVLPVVGKSVDAAQTISSSLDDIALNGLPPVVKASSSLDADLFKPKNGRFNLAAMQRLAPAVEKASTVLTVNRETISKINSGSLIGPLQKPTSDLKSKIGDAQSAASSAANAMRLAPTMLGAGHKRTYLLMFQNNAEVRSTGGVPGAFAILTADNGKITIGKQGSARDIPQYGQPLVKLTKSERDVYGQLMAKDFRDTNFTPDFPRTAQIARAMLQDKLGIKVDGVLSVDPVALGYLLKGTGPIKAAASTTLTTNNAVDILLNDVYARYANPLAQDAFFADSAKRIFEAVTKGVGDSRTSLEQLVKASNEHRILVWSANKTEQGVLAPTEVAGVFPGKLTASPQVGAYLNDATESKMQYYLTRKTTVRSVRCSSDGVQTLQLTTTFTSTAPADASELPAYITGEGVRIPKGTMLLDTRFFAPSGGEFSEFTFNGKLRTNNGVLFDTRPTNFAAFPLKPGQTVTIGATMTTAKNQRGDGVFSTTPGAQSTPNAVRIPSSCH
ncbi:MAG: hypothetical protein JWN39_2905 [Ilumatobacteraceae bacterium]|nr:hypothetical protein [Ilumatobacteraceae bacterium]